MPKWRGAFFQMGCEDAFPSVFCLEAGVAEPTDIEKDARDANRVGLDFSEGGEAHFQELLLSLAQNLGSCISKS